VQQEVNDDDMNLFLVAYISGFIAQHVLCAVRCDECKTWLTSPVMSFNAFIYFLKYKDDEHNLTYPSERLVETVSAFVTVLDGMIQMLLTHIQLKRKLQLPSRTPLILDGFSLLIVCFTIQR